MEPDILFYVVYIIRDNRQNATVTTTDTHYMLQADPCQSHQYHVEIAAVNVVGGGENILSVQKQFLKVVTIVCLYCLD